MAQRITSIGNFPMYVHGVAAFLVCQGEKYNSHRILQLCNAIGIPKSEATNKYPKITGLKCAKTWADRSMDKA